MTRKPQRKHFAYKSFPLLYRILQRLQHGSYQEQIARQLGTKRQNIRHYIRKLEQLGYIKCDFRDKFKAYSLTKQGEKLLAECQGKSNRQSSSLYVNKGSIRSHTLKAKLKILSQAEADFSQEQGYRVVQKANWQGRVFVMPFPIAMTVEVTTENVIINFHKFYSQNRTYYSDMFSTLWKGLLAVYMKFQGYGYGLDIYNPEIIDLHIANERPDLNDQVTASSQISVALGRQARAVFPSKQTAKAWIDRSHGDVEIEANDMLYEEKLLTMPETIDSMSRQLVPIVRQFGDQLALHLHAVQGLDKGVAEMNKLLKELNRKLNSDQKKP